MCHKLAAGPRGMTAWRQQEEGGGSQGWGTWRASRPLWDTAAGVLMRSGPRTEEDRENPHTRQNVLCSLQKSLKLLSGLFVLFCVIPPPSPPPTPPGRGQARARRRSVAFPAVGSPGCMSDEYAFCNSCPGPRHMCWVGSRGRDIFRTRHMQPLPWLRPEEGTWAGKSGAQTPLWPPAPLRPAPRPRHLHFRL